jgi:hypothetical protein
VAASVDLAAGHLQRGKQAGGAVASESRALVRRPSSPALRYRRRQTAAVFCETPNRRAIGRTPFTGGASQDPLCPQAVFRRAVRDLHRR